MMTGRIRDVGQDVLKSPFEREIVATPVTSTYSFLIPFLEEDFIENVMYKLYCELIIICINNNTAVNNYGRILNLISLLKIPMGTLNFFFFEIYMQFWHASSQSFASPALMSSSSCLRLLPRLPRHFYPPFSLSSNNVL